MSVRARADDGLGLIEVVIAMFLLGLIAVAILPGLINGLQYSAGQSTVATATRQVNGLLDQVRQAPACSTMGAILGTPASPRSFTDGRGQTFITRATIGSCSAGAAVTLHIVAVQGTTTLATSDALVMIPPNPVTVP